MNCTRPAAQPSSPASLPARRHALPRQTLTVQLPGRDEPCQHQATAEYQAARLGKLLKSPPSQEQTQMANMLLQDMIEAYRQALHKARQS
jgi:hypothetical protein